MMNSRCLIDSIDGGTASIRSFQRVFHNGIIDAIHAEKAYPYTILPQVSPLRMLRIIRSDRFDRTHCACSRVATHAGGHRHRESHGKCLSIFATEQLRSIAKIMIIGE